MITLWTMMKTEEVLIKYYFGPRLLTENFFCIKTKLLFH